MTAPRPTVIPAVTYADPEAAFAWLQTAFGLQPVLAIRDPGGQLVHAEMRCGDGLVMLGGEWHERTRAPGALDGRLTQTIHVAVPDVDGHCARARAAGATIAAEPEDQFYGDRTYRALDLEGHMWTFAQTLRELTPAEWDAASGLVTTVY